MLLQSHLDLRAMLEKPVEVVGADGVERSQARASARQLETVFGEVRVPRQLYQAPGVEGLAPIDASLNLPSELYSMRNVLANVPNRHQKRIGRELVAVLHAASLVEAKKALRSFRARFAGQFAEAVTCLERGFDAGTQYFAFPEAHWLRIRSNNGLERLHGEIKRRTRAVGAFPDRTSALRLITAVAQQSVSIWRDRLYLDMTLLDAHYAAAA